MATSIFLIAIDPSDPSIDYSKFVEVVASIGFSWWHHMPNLWLVRTNLSASVIFDHLAKACSVQDRVLIIKIAQDFSGRLPSEAWKWLEVEYQKLHFENLSL